MKLAVALLLLSARAGAVGEEPRELARQHATRATQLYKLGQFQTALDEYTKAYEALPAPNLLFNLGQCHYMLKSHEKALFFFQGFLRERPDSPHRPVVEELITESTRELEAARLREKERHSDDTERTAAQQRAAEAIRQREAAERALEELRTSQAGRLKAEDGLASRRRARSLQWGGIASGTVGLALLGVGVGLGAYAQGVAGQVSSLSQTQGTWSPSYQALEQGAATSALAANVFYAVGGAVVAVGAITAVVGWRRALAAPRFSIAPMAGGATLMATCVF